MSNLINFFFSFDKLMKEKLVISFFWLAIIFSGLAFFSEALSAVRLGPLAAVVDFFIFFVSILLTLVSLRLLCEIAVAIFRINDNLSPDGGKSETADIDPIAEARKAAEAAASRARDVSKSASEKKSTAPEATAKPAATAPSAKRASPRKAPTSKPSPTRSTGTQSKAAATKAKPAASSKGKKKPGPKPGSKRPVTKDGVRLKKDGTPAKRPGPKKS